MSRKRRSPVVQATQSFNASANPPALRVPKQAHVEALLNAITSYETGDALKLIKKFGINIVNCKNEHNETPAMYVAQTRLTAVMVNLIERGAHLDVQNTNGHSALHIAASRGYVDGLKLLLKAKASIDLVDKDGETPLYSAILQNQIECADLLLQAGACNDITNKVGISLQQAAKTQEMRDLLNCWVSRRDQEKQLYANEIAVFLNGTQEKIITSHTRLPLKQRPNAQGSVP